jgi:hypothetical protein
MNTPAPRLDRELPMQINCRRYDIGPQPEEIAMRIHEDGFRVTAFFQSLEHPSERMIAEFQCPQPVRQTERLARHFPGDQIIDRHAASLAVFLK